MLKGRDFTKPLAFLVRDYDDLDDYIVLTTEQKEFLKNYPHPWSILGDRREDCILPSFLSENQYSKISLRVAENCIHFDIRGILQYPLFLTSANISGWKESMTADVAKSIFPGIDVVDGGVCSNPPSDIFSFGENGELVFARKNRQ